MSKSTLEAWYYQETSDAYTHIVRDGKGVLICQLAQDTSGRAESQARLIASAPALLQALQKALDSLISAKSDWSALTDDLHGPFEGEDAIAEAKAVLAEAQRPPKKRRRK